MKLLYTLIFITSTLFLSSQTKPATYKDFFQEGSYLLLESNMEKATENFEVAYQLDSSSANINYMLGICYLQSALQKSKAEYHLARAVKKCVKNLSNRPCHRTRRAAPGYFLLRAGPAHQL